jgi:putative transposase
LRSADDGDLMRRLLRTILQAMIDAEAASHIGADPHGHSDRSIASWPGRPP